MYICTYTITDLFTRVLKDTTSQIAIITSQQPIYRHSEIDTQLTTRHYKEFRSLAVAAQRCEQYATYGRMICAL